MLPRRFFPGKSSLRFAGALVRRPWVADHICPWQSCYRSSQLLGGKTGFVLSTSGHIAALVNPPGNAKASYQVCDNNSLDPQDWKRDTRTEKGFWWDDYAA